MQTRPANGKCNELFLSSSLHFPSLHFALLRFALKLRVREGAVSNPERTTRQEDGSQSIKISHNEMKRNEMNGRALTALHCTAEHSRAQHCTAASVAIIDHSVRFGVTVQFSSDRAGAYKERDAVLADISRGTGLVVEDEPPVLKVAGSITSALQCYTSSGLVSRVDAQEVNSMGQSHSKRGDRSRSGGRGGG